MKHTILYIAAIAVAAMTFGACSDDSGITPEPTYEGNKVIVSASVGNAFTRTSPIGTEDEQKVFKSGDQINISDGTNNTTYTLDGSSWNAATGQYLTWTGEQKTFQAYYPVVTGNSYAQGTLPIDQSYVDKIAAADYMTATKTTTETDDHVLSLEFGRQTARVIVTIAGYNDQYTNTTTVENVKIYSSLYVPASDSYTAITPYKKMEDGSYIALVAPEATDNDSQKFLEIDIHPNGNTSATETLTVTGIPAMEAGKSYTYNVTVGKNAATINSVSVSDWGAGTTIPGGKATRVSSPKDVTNITAQDFKTYLESEYGTEQGLTFNPTGTWNDDLYPVLGTFLAEHPTADLTFDMSQLSVTEIPAEAFSQNGTNSKGLTHIILPSTVTTIGNKAFQNTGLKDIDLKNVTTIGDNAFEGSNLQSITATKDCQTGKNVFANTKLGDGDGGFTLPTWLYPTKWISLADWNPLAGTSIKNVTVPAKCTLIYRNTFAGMSELETVVFESTKVTDIGQAAFNGCTNLKTIDLSNLTTDNALPTINSNSPLTFSGINKGNITVLVKDAEMKTKFESHNKWGKEGFKEFKVKE